MYFRGPEVVPIAGRQMNVLGVNLFRNNRSDEEIAAEEELVVLAVELLGSGIFEKNWLHQRNAGARGFFQRRINIRKQLVAQLDVAFADRFLLWAARPRLVIGGALRCMIAIYRIENAQLVPARQEVRRWRASETADIRANHRVTGKSEAHDLGNAHSDVIPGGAVVAGPGGGIAFGARISGAR